MVSESVEFVTEYFDNTFSPVISKSDERISSLKKYCNTLSKMRLKRAGKGSIVATVTVMDSLKYLEPVFHNFIRKLDSGEIKLHDDSGKEVCDIVMASFGKDEDDNPVNCGWKGPVSDFTSVMGEATEAGNKSLPGTNGFYLRSVPETVIKNKSAVEYIIFGIIVKYDNECYDTAAISVIGIPSSRKDEIHERAVLSMFNY